MCQGGHCGFASNLRVLPAQFPQVRLDLGPLRISNRAVARHFPTLFKYENMARSTLLAFSSAQAPLASLVPTSIPGPSSAVEGNEEVVSRTCC